MGGKAFSPALRTPRMSPTTYHALLSKYISVLSKYYVHVGSPREAPEKTSHGDIDILVCTPIHNSPPDTATLAKILQATRSIAAKSATIFAIPYPSDLPSDEEGENHIQLDMQRCETVERFNWMLFFNSLGDFWNILGTALRRYGLTANDHGLHLRVREIETENKQHALISLTSDPADIFEFLGLDVKEFDEGWSTLEEMYAFLAQHRFFRRDSYTRVHHHLDDPHSSICNDANGGGDGGGGGTKEKKRIETRAIYRQFVDEFLPSWQDVGRKRVRREEMLELVLNRWGKVEEYEKKMNEWRKYIDEKPVKEEIREMGIVMEMRWADAWVNWQKTGRIEKVKKARQRGGRNVLAKRIGLNVQYSKPTKKMDRCT